MNYNLLLGTRMSEKFASNLVDLCIKLIMSLTGIYRSADGTLSCTVAAVHMIKSVRFQEALLPEVSQNLTERLLFGIQLFFNSSQKDACLQMAKLLHVLLSGIFSQYIYR